MKVIFRILRLQDSKNLQIESKLRPINYNYSDDNGLMDQFIASVPNEELVGGGCWLSPLAT